jgi:hypothetical protein
VDLLVLVLVRVHTEADEALRAEGRRHAVRRGVRLAVVGELEIGVRRSGRRSRVAQLERDIDHVAVALEGVGLGDFQAVLAAGRELDLDSVAARRKAALALLHPPQAAVVRPGVARQAALRFILVLRSEEHERLGRIPRVLVLKELHALQRGAERVELGHHEIGRDADRFPLGRRLGARNGTRRGLGGRFGRGRLRRRHALLRGGRRRRRGGAALLVPRLPQHQQRKAEDEKQDESLGIHLHFTAPDRSRRHARGRSGKAAGRSAGRRARRRGA